MENVLVFAKGNKSFAPKKEIEKYKIDKFRFEFKELSRGETFEVKGRRVTVFRDGEWEATEYDNPSTDLLKETWVSGSIYSGTGNGQMVQRVIEPRISTDGYGSLYKIDGLGEDGLGYRYFCGPKSEGSTRARMFSGIPTKKLEEIESGEAVKSKSIPNIQVYEDYSPDFGNISHEGGVKYNSGKKPLKMINKLVDISNLDHNDIVLDFFAGSATTAHSIFESVSMGGNVSKFILVQLPERLSAHIKEQKDICSFLTSINKPHILSELSKERIRRAGAKILEENPDQADTLDVGFRVLKIDSSNMLDVQDDPDTLSQGDLMDRVAHIKRDRTEEDLLFQVMLNRGLELSQSIEVDSPAGQTVFYVGGDNLAACFATSGVTSDTVKAMAARRPLYAVFRDDGFGSDADKINAGQLLKQMTDGHTRMLVI